ncbi:glycosyltransferase family 2 protein [Acetobacter estunensis]|uniref:glycosyltransferase family 2 protein n=1 Tax=Acetobacter estunensis TaxID=104097 RepID=UPI001C2D38E6|nr:glycosyltransferase family 2 protein [Acetobacter estunensis]MBV1837917.1 glycosyltransferase family 2 protein [Acetobacter estunensis]
MAELSPQFVHNATECFNNLRSSDEWQINDHVHLPELENAAFIMLVKNSDDTIRLSLEHHYNLGFRHFFILDNNSTDKTAEQIFTFRTNFSAAKVCYITDYEPGYVQAVKMKAVMDFIRTYTTIQEHPIDWVFFLDADEFITCCVKHGEAAAASMGAMLRDPDVQILVFNWAQSALFDQQTQQITRFGEKLSTTTMAVSRAMQVHVTKVALRLSANFLPQVGNHYVEGEGPSEDHVRSMIAAGFVMLHFPMRTVEQLRQKLDDGVKALDAGRLDPALGAHWRHYHNLVEKHGPDILRQILVEHIQGSVG